VIAIDRANLQSRVRPLNNVIWGPSIWGPTPNKIIRKNFSFYNV
jgi:hypothetical protein